MAAFLKPSEYEEVTDPNAPVQPAAASASSPAAAGQPSAPAPVAGPQGKLAPTQYEDLPDHANGASPDTPVNTSPLDYTERFKMALGNEAGNTDMLKKRFEDVQKDSEGNLVVKDRGVWHRVDGKTLGDADAWSATKGILKGMGAALAVASDFTGSKSGRRLADATIRGDDVAKETLGTIAQATPMVGAAALGATVGAMTGGVGLAGFAAAGADAAGAGLAAGGAEAIRTSMGRLEGTYQATPEQQLKDIGFETLLNFGGTFIPAGVKPTAHLIADKLPEVAKKLADMPAGSREMVKQVYGALSGVGAENIDTLVNNGAGKDGVSALMKRLNSQFPDAASYIDETKRIQIGAVKEMADSADQMLRTTWQRNEANVVKAVPSNFTAKLDTVSHNVFTEGLDDGLTYVQKAGSSKPLPLEQAKTLAATGKLPEGYRFQVRSPAELQKFIQEGGGNSLAGAGSIAFGPKNKEALGMVQDFYDTVKKMGDLKEKTGPAAAKQLLTASKVLDDVTWQFGNVADDLGLGALKARMAATHELIRGQVADRFAAGGEKAALSFEKLNNDYSAMKTGMNDLLAARQKAARGTDEVYERLLNKVSARPGRNVVAKDGTFNGTLKLASEMGLPEAQKFADLQTKIRVAEAAKAFNPWVGGGLGASSSLSVAVSSAALGHPAVAATAAGVVALRSPTMTKHVVNTVNALWSGKQFLDKIGSAGVQKLVDNPAALNAFVSTVTSAPAIQQSTTQQLLGHAAQSIQQWQQQGQGQGQ